MILPFVLCSCGDEIDEPDLPMFKEPCTHWGCTKSNVKSFMSGYTMLRDDSELLAYDGKYKENLTMYNFKSDKLESAAVTVSTSTVSAEEIVDFMNTNYQYIKKVDDIYAFATSDGNTAVLLTVSKTDYDVYYMVVYTSLSSASAPKAEIEKINAIKGFEMCKDNSKVQALSTAIERTNK